MTCPRAIAPPRIPYGPEEDTIIAALFPVNTTAAVAALINRTASSVSQRALRLGVTKCPVYLATKAHRLNGSEPASIVHRFKPGQAPPNKGQRHPKGWAPGRMATTQFKKGSRPLTWKPVGHERVTVDGYAERKVADTGVTRRDYVPIHRLVWEAANGPVPAGHVVAFLPGRKTTDVSAITVDGLELVSRADLMRRNSFHNYPKPIARLIQLRGAVVRQINRRSRNDQ